MEKIRGSGLLETPALFMLAEFPRRTLLGSSMNIEADYSLTLGPTIP
jgi:hypothetical protein